MFATVKPMKNIKSNVYKEKPIKEQSLFPVLSVGDLLAPKWREQTLKELRQFIPIPEKYYQTVYYQLVENFAEFVQVLPSIEGGRLGSLFDEGLKRALIAVQLHQLENAQNDEPLFTYAVFTAALLIDLRKVLANKKIMISDEKGCFICEWSPFEGNIGKFGTHYKVRRYRRPITRLSTYITLLLARQVMPEAGFLWLAEDLRLLNMWMAALVGDEDSSGGVGHFLNLAKKRLREMGSKPNYTMPVEITEPDHTALGEKFWVWLKQMIAAGQKGLDPANPSIYETPEGIFLEVPEIFKEFCIEAKLPDINWKEAADRFGDLGIAEFIELTDNNLAQQKFVYLNKDKILQAAQATQQNINFKENDDAKNLVAKFFTNMNKVQEEIAIGKSQKHSGMLNLERGWFTIVSQKMARDKNLHQFSEKLKDSKKFSTLEKLSVREVWLEKKLNLRIK